MRQACTRALTRCFNLQGRLLASPSPRTSGGSWPMPRVSICKADYWLPQERWRVCGRRRFRVSICKADYWLPQVQLASLLRLMTHGFQSARQIIGFPKAAIPAGQRRHLTRVSICKADYWLPQVVGKRLHQTGHAAVSICKADYWLPQGHVNLERRT